MLARSWKLYVALIRRNNVTGYTRKTYALGKAFQRAERWEAKHVAPPVAEQLGYVATPRGWEAV